MAVKALTIGYADMETTNHLDLEAEGLTCRPVGKGIFCFNTDGINVGVPIVKPKCIGLIVKRPSGETIELMYHTIPEFLVALAEYRVDRCYFHNLKFDDSFIASYMRNDEVVVGAWKAISKKRVISHKGVVYEDMISFTGPRDPVKHRAIKHRCVIWDSMKIWANPLEKLGKDFGVYKGGTTGGSRALEVGCSKEMEEYCLQDCRVMMTAMEYYFERCREETHGQRPYGWMTAASTAYNLACLDATGRLGGKKELDAHFPPCDEDHGFPNWLRDGYKGAVPLLDEAIKNKVLYDVFVFDVNSMYPTQLFGSALPMGRPIHLDIDENDKDGMKKLMTLKERGKLWIAMVKMKIDVKAGHRATYMLKSKGPDGKTLCDHVNDYEGMNMFKESCQVITSVDIEYIMRDYDIRCMDVVEAIGFEADVDRNDRFFGNRIKGNILSHFVGRWYEIKEKASKSGDKSLKAFAKLILNALYGKFGANPEHIGGAYFFEGDDEDMIRVRENDEVDVDENPKYLPLAMFVTSYARNMISKLCNAIGWKHVAYTDTDSVHVYGMTVDECVSRITGAGYAVDGTDLGALKFESRWREAMYVRNKGYFHFGELDPYTGELLHDKDGNEQNEIKMAGANAFENCKCMADVVNKELKVKQKRGYRVRGGVLIFEHDTTVDTTDDDDGMVHVKRVKKKNLTESARILREREDAIFRMMGV